MYATTSKQTESTTSTVQRSQTREKAHLTLQRKTNGRDAEALARTLAKGTAGGQTLLSSGVSVNSPSNHLSRLVQSSTIQPKLKIGKPNDRFEQEADQMADKVMTFPSAGIQTSSTLQKSESLQSRQKIQRQVEEEEEPVQAKSLIHRQAEEEEEEAVQPKTFIQRQPEEEEEPVQAKSLIQRQAEEEEEPVQAKSLIQRQAEEEEEEPVQAKSLIQRQAEEEEEEPVQAKSLIQRQPEEEGEPVQAKSLIQRQAEEEEEEAVQAKSLIQRQPEEEEEEPVQAKSLIQRQPEEEEEEPVQAKSLIQRQPEEEEEPVQAKSLIQRQAEEEEEEAVQAKSLIQRQTEEEEEPVHAKSLIQRQAEEEKEEQVQAKSLIQRQAEEEEVQAKASNISAVGSDFQNRLRSTGGAGHPLSESTRSQMEPGFGSDFGSVRVHTGREAVRMNEEIGAQAFTHGSDIYFNEGKFNADSSQGKRLLAHELGHTIQQGAAPAIRPAMTQSPALQRQEAAGEEAIDVEAEIAASEEDATAAIDLKPAEQAKKAAEQKEAPEPEEKEVPEEPVKEPGEKAKGKTAGRPKKAAVDFVPAKKEEEEEKGDVGQYLEQESAGVCAKAAGEAQVLAENEKTHDDAEQKLGQTEEAVKPPEEEGQSQSNAEQVEGLDQAPAPEPDDKKAKETMTGEVEKVVPKKLKQLNEFKSKGKAKVVGSKVLGKVKEETNAVQGAYNEIEKAPPPKPQEKPPVELPGEEIAPETPELNLGKDAVPPIKEEHTDFTEFDQKSDAMLEKEGITDEQMKMVDEGDLFEAQKERKGLKQKTTEQPAQLKEFAQKEVNKVDKDLKQEEKKSKTEMRSKRKENLAGTQDKQKKTKTALELKREAVTRKINGIYEKAKTSVTTKLNNLEKDSLNAFDRGQAKASAEFENEVKSDINAFKRKRYSGFWGPAKWLKDKLVGIDDFPEVTRAFEKAKNNFITKIDQLILQITKAGQTVIKGCKEELAVARKEIKAFVDGLGPELKAAGRQAMTEMKSKLAEMDKFIDKKKKELARKLCDKKDEAIKKIDEKIEKMKEEMSGALSKLGNLILEAALKFFKWALKKAGYNANQLMGIIAKGKAVIKKIVGDPIGFIMNIVNAVKMGINNFQNNIKKHLVGGLINWLTGAMGDVGIQLPSKFDLKGIISVVLQILGLTWANIRQKLVNRLGEKVVGFAEKSVDIVKKIITEGPMALWEMIKAKAAEIKAKVMEGIRNWAIVELVKQGIIKLISFLNPAGAIIQAILAIYNTIMFFVENWDRIVQFVKTVFNSIADIAMGKISAAAAAVERAMAMTIPIILNFLARLLNLSGIGKAVRKIIMKIRKPIDKVLNKVIDFIAKKAKKLISKGKAAFKKAKKTVKKAKEKIKNILFPQHKFKAGGESHTLKIVKRGGRSLLLISSTPHPVREFLDTFESKHGDTLTPDKKAKIKTAKAFINSDVNPLITKINKAKKKSTVEKLQRQLLEKEVKLSSIIKEILGSTGKLKDTEEKYKLEGLTGTYGSMPKPKYDDLTADHQPQAAILVASAKFSFFKGEGGAAMRDRAANRANNGFAINLNAIRHKAGRTYGGKGTGTKNAFLASVEKETRSLRKHKEKRDKVVELIKIDLRKDVEKMREVVGSDENWTELKRLQIPDPQKKDLKEKTKKQILSGQNRVAAQDLESLKGK